MAQAFGGEFKCLNGHKGLFYFFDSQPTEIGCPYCDDGTKLVRIRILDMGQTSGKRLGRLRRKPNAVDRLC